MRHIERTKLLLFVLDLSEHGSPFQHDIGSLTDRKSGPVADLQILMNELFVYDPSLLFKPAIIFANKLDLIQSKHHLNDTVSSQDQYMEDLKTDLKAVARSMGIQTVVFGSAEDGNGLRELAGMLRLSLPTSAAE